MSHPDTFFDDGPPISQLQAAVKSLEAYVHAAVPPARPVAVEAASSASVPGKSRTRIDPLTPVQQFSRQELVAGRWKALARSHVAVCGLGGMGAIAADALVRAGVGRMLLIDNERIRWSCMGRAGFLPDEVGFSRAQALRLRLQSIRATATTTTTTRAMPNDAGVVVDSFAVDWASEVDLTELRKKLKVSSVGAVGAKPVARVPVETEDGDDETDDAATAASTSTSHSGSGLGLFEALTQRRPYDAVLSCLEEDAERLALNQICLELSLPLLQVSLSPCNAKIVIRTVLPGHTSCLDCTASVEPHLQQSTPSQEPSQASPNAMDQVTKSIAKAFPASLPHVELMAGGLLGQHTIKFLLETGDFVPCFTVNALTFEIESYAFAPNRTCTNATCRQRQDDEQPRNTTR